MYDWNQLTIPYQDDVSNVENINPAEAYRRQVKAINSAAPLYAELELVEAWLSRARRVEAELRRRILSQHQTKVKSSLLRTNDLIDAVVLDKASEFINSDGEQKDITELMLKLRRRVERLEARKVALEKSLRAIAGFVQVCDNVMNWAKHEARLELGRR